jgi:hypothetical protein
VAIAETTSAVEGSSRGEVSERGLAVKQGEPVSPVGRYLELQIGQVQLSRVKHLSEPRQVDQPARSVYVTWYTRLSIRILFLLTSRKDALNSIVYCYI